MLLKALCRGLIVRHRSKLSQVSVRHHNFEGHDAAKAVTVTMLSQEDDDLTYIEAYSPIGFRLKTGFKIIGPCAIFPRSVLHWNVASSEDISPESLSLFTILEPKIDLLILGIGDSGAKYDTGIIKYLRSHKINVEILPTDRACSTFNFLNSERRYVAGALIPPHHMHIDTDEDAVIRSQIEHRNLYELESGFGDVPDAPGAFDEAVKIMEQGYKVKPDKPAEKSESKDSQDGKK